MGRTSVAMSFHWVLLWLVAVVADGHPHATHYVHGRSRSQDVVLDWGNTYDDRPLSNGRHGNGGFARRITTPALLHELRGGASKRSSQQKKKMANSEYYYGGLARALMPRLASEGQGDAGGGAVGVVEEKVSQALERLSKSQQALKGLDGAAHEAYQRTKAPSSVDSTSVAGRAARSAARTGCTADALLAAELCDLFSLVDIDVDVDPTQQTTNRTTSSHPFNFSTPTTTHTDNEKEEEVDDDHTLTGRRILLNITHVNVTYYDAKEKNRLALPVSVLVLWEPEYLGGAGLDHGGVDGLLLVSTTTTTTTPTTSSRQRLPKPRGRLLVLIQDGYANDLERTIACLDVEPQVVALNVGLVANEASSVNGLLYKAAGQVLQTILPTLQTTLPHQNENTTTTNSNDDDQESLPAIHFVGQSLAGGVASLAATILDGSLSMILFEKETMWISII